MIDPNVFHAHLDKCERCRNQPFNLCPIGALKLREAVTPLNQKEERDGERR